MANAGHLLRANDAERKPVMSEDFLSEGDKKNLSSWSSIYLYLFWTPSFCLPTSKAGRILLKEMREVKKGGFGMIIANVQFSV